MEDNFVAVVKLISGEELLGPVQYSDGGILIKNPLIIEEIYLGQFGKQKGVEISKWIKSSTDEYHYIPMDFIVTIGELKNPVLSLYYKTLEDLNKKSFKKINKVKKYNGYRETIHDARLKLEDIFKKY
jgi:hypothetical protein